MHNIKHEILIMSYTLAEARAMIRTFGDLDNSLHSNLFLRSESMEFYHQYKTLPDIVHAMNLSASEQEQAHRYINGDSKDRLIFAMIDMYDTPEACLENLNECHSKLTAHEPRPDVTERYNHFKAKLKKLIADQN